MKNIKSNNSNSLSKENLDKINKKNNSLQRREALKRMAILTAGGLVSTFFIGSCEKDRFDDYSDYSNYSEYSNYTNAYTNAYGNNYYNYPDYNVRYYNYVDSAL